MVFFAAVGGGGVRWGRWFCFSRVQNAMAFLMIMFSLVRWSIYLIRAHHMPGAVLGAEIKLWVSKTVIFPIPVVFPVFGSAWLYHPTLTGCKLFSIFSPCVRRNSLNKITSHLECCGWSNSLPYMQPMTSFQGIFFWCWSWLFHTKQKASQLVESFFIDLIN